MSSVQMLNWQDPQHLKKPDAPANSIVNNQMFSALKWYQDKPRTNLWRRFQQRRPERHQRRYSQRLWWCWAVELRYGTHWDAGTPAHHLEDTQRNALSFLATNYCFSNHRKKLSNRSTKSEKPDTTTMLNDCNLKWKAAIKGVMKWEIKWNQERKFFSSLKSASHSPSHSLLHNSMAKLCLHMKSLTPATTLLPV